MTAAVIIISVIAFIILLVIFLLTAYVKFELEYDSEPFVKVKYLLFSRILMPETKQSIKRKKRKEKKEKKKQEKAEKKRKKELRGQHLKSGKKAGKKSENNKPSQKAAAPQAAKGETAKNTEPENTSNKSKNVKTSNKEIPKKDKPNPDLDLIINCINAAKPYVKKLFKKIRIYDVFAEIVVGGEDAASTALNYGVHCAAVYGFIGFLKNTVSFKTKKIDIKADFDLEKTDYYIYGKVKLRLATLISCLIWGYSAVQGAMNEDPPKGQAPKNKGTAKKAA